MTSPAAAAAGGGRPAAEPASNLSQYMEEFTALSETSATQQMSAPPKPQISPQTNESTFQFHISVLHNYVVGLLHN